MHYDLTITVPGDADDAHRIISAMVEHDLVPPGRVTYGSIDGRVRIRWERMEVDERDTVHACLSHALAELASVAAGNHGDTVPHIHLDLDESRRLTQADFDPAEDL